MKGSIVAASVALVGAVAGYEHKAHAGFHVRRGDYKKEEVCTVYKTVYVTARTLYLICSNLFIRHESQIVEPTPKLDECWN